MEALLDQVEAIEEHVLDFERRHLALLPAIHPRYQQSARNLLHYVALRQLDLRRLQLDLARAGLSSLGRSEGAVLSALHCVRQRIAESLHSAALQPDLDPATRDRLLERVAHARRPGPAPAVDADRGEALLHEHTRALLGHKPAHRHVSIMVTAPSADEADRRWLAGLLTAGMDCLRVNCAHEDEDAWQHVLDALTAATGESGRPCRVLMDIAGPKLRTGALAPGAAVIVFRPVRDAFGRVIQPAVVPIVCTQSQEEPSAALALPAEHVAQLAEGDLLRVTDTRGRPRELQILGVQVDRAVARCEQSLYLALGCRVEVRRQGKALFTCRSGPVPARPQAIELAVGEGFYLTGELVPGQPALRGAAGEVVHPAIVPCTLPQALEHLRPGERVLFDDGKIEALVESVCAPRATLRVVRAGSGRARLRAEKGINFPETRIDVDAVTDQDRRHLAFAASHADAVGLSFLRTAADVRRAVEAVQQAVQEVGRPPQRPLGVVIKVETRSAFDQLPALLLAAMESFPAGVMIARGDLAVEIGFERLAEVQEEILWLCEAAHLPSIWATQVLDELAQTGVPSRAEVTDASMAVRAECVMLNKGPFVDRAVRALDDILRRMEHHTYKKRALYRRLSISDALVTVAGPGEG